MATPKVQPESIYPLQGRLGSARRQTDMLFRILRPEALYDRPIPERHRLVFYLGHLEAFDWNLIARGAFDHLSFHPEYDKLFAFGIDPVDGQLPHDVPSDWPTIEDVAAYNREVRNRIDSALNAPANSLPKFVADGTLLNVAIEHRLMHAETLAYLLHQLPYDRKIAPEVSSSTVAARTVEPHMAGIPSGKATLGLRRSSGAFGWDNEFEEHAIDVNAFRIGAYPVTNREFLAFLSAGGYDDARLWSREAWAWKSEARISHPLLWQRDGEEWKYRGMFAQVPLPFDCPAYVSHAEASAYARWEAQSLPTEAQWHRAAYGTPAEIECMYPWGDVEPSASRGNFNFQHWDPTPVNAHPAGQSAFGIYDLLGNGWEWTSTPFAPFPGFEPFSFYPGYSANFFDGKHFVMKGGSQRTAACMLRRSFRNWFQPHYPYVYAKFRTVEE
ncbi:MAG TPA: SUMF1/EgtB/PvdO family nonheme iron enzyme [Candidatus Acidoferrales bacterium]|nr:SUMF1/EgtB/PvdO family nonheme iron enzyme [Candidatus Acidoferrales bacterium]